VKKLWLSLALVGCASAPRRDEPPKIKILTYNVENLFDTEDDPDKLDDAYIPAADKDSLIFQNKCRVRNSGARNAAECLNKDWSKGMLERKLDRLADVVGQVPGGPDVLIVEEVESLAVLERWRTNQLAKFGYANIAYVKGPDERGINPAILTRLPLVGEPKLHEIDFTPIEPNPRPSRGILEAALELPNGETLNVFAVHFPSQGAPTPFRRQALRALMDVTARLPAGALTLVGGDFNISAKEEYKEKLFREVGDRFDVSHEIGCRDCVGTIYYPRDATWSFFDVLLFSKNLTGPGLNWRLDPESIRVVNTSLYQTRFDGTPARFGRGGGALGVSDHWPLYAELHLKDEVRR